MVVQQRVMYKPIPSTSRDVSLPSKAQGYSSLTPRLLYDLMSATKEVNQSPKWEKVYQPRDYPCHGSKRLQFCSENNSEMLWDRGLVSNRSRNPPAKRNSPLP